MSEVTDPELIVKGKMEKLQVEHSAHFTSLFFHHFGNYFVSFWASLDNFRPHLTKKPRILVPLAVLANFTSEVCSARFILPAILSSLNKGELANRSVFLIYYDSS